MADPASDEEAAVDEELPEKDAGEEVAVAGSDEEDKKVPVATGSGTGDDGNTDGVVGDGDTGDDDEEDNEEGDDEDDEEK